MSHRLLLVMLVSATLAGLSTATQAAPACRQGCRRARAACIREARAGLAAARAACASGAGRDCRAQAKRRFRAALGSCGRAHRATCLPCCVAGGKECSGDPPSTFDQTYDVTYDDGAVVIDEATVHAHLLGRSDDGATFRFGTAAAAARRLVPGQVVIFAGMALRRVSGVTDTGREIVVDTQPATLDEAIRRGTIGWRYDVAWDRVPAESLAAAVPLAGRTLAAEVPPAFTSQAGAPLAFSGTIMGWAVEFELTPGPARLDMKLVASLSLAGTKAITVAGTGWISGFTDEMLLTYENSTPQSMTTKVVGLTGEMNLEWHAFKPNDQGLIEISKFALPVKLPITFLVGPVPVTVAVKAELQVVPELRVDQASSGGKFTVTYRSDQGFSVDDSGQAPFGTLHQSSPAMTGGTGSAGWGVVGFGFGVEFPRLELSLFGETAMAFITLKTYGASLFTPGTTLTNDIPPCQMAFTDLFAAAGWQLSFLGWKGPGDTTELWRAPRYEVFGDGKPCSITG